MSKSISIKITLIIAKQFFSITQLIKWQAIDGLVNNSTTEELGRGISKENYSFIRNNERLVLRDERKIREICFTLGKSTKNDEVKNRRYLFG